MSFLASLFNPERRSALTTVPEALWRGGSIRAESASGITITPERSLASTAVFACVRVLSEGVGALPLHLYERIERHGRAGKSRATQHPLYMLLHMLPNPEMTSMELRETLVGHCAIRGNAYTYIEWGNDGYPRELWPLRPDRVTIWRYNGELYYSVQMPDDTYVTLTTEKIMHVRGLMYNGVVGMSPIELARNAVGLSLATEEFGARFFGNDARPGVILRHPGILEDEVYERLVQSWETRHSGLSNAQKVAILEDGMDVKEVGLSPDHAQFLETRKFQVSEIARIFRVPPHMIADLDRATFSNVEHQDLAFVKHTLRPWLTRIEQAIARDLLLPAERLKYFAEHMPDDLLRGETKTRYESYGIGRQNGWLSANDIRERENMEPIEGGDVYLVPLNMIPANQAAQMPQSTEGEGARGDVFAGEQRALATEIPPEKRAAAAGRHRLAQNALPMFADAFARVLRREVQDVGAAVRKHFGRRDAPQFRAWLEEFYTEHADWTFRQILAVYLSYGEMVGNLAAEEVGEQPRSLERFIRAYVAAAASRHATRHRARLEEVMEDNAEDPQPALEAELDHWSEEYAEDMAREESTRANNAFAVAFYVAVGIAVKRWVSLGDSCPYCTQLDGRSIEISNFFIREGEQFQGTDETVLSVRVNVGHPPAHNGCDCMVVAG